MFLVFGFCAVCWASADAQFPKPRHSSTPQVTTTTVQTSPAPQAQAPPPVVNVAPSEVAVFPQLTLPPAGTLEEIREWLKTAFLGLLTAIGGLIAARGVKTAVPGVPADTPAVVTTIMAKLADPAFHQALEARGLQVALAAVESGIPKSLVQGAVGLAPAGGTINAAYDATVGPLIHNLGIKALQDLVAKHGVAQ
jgi:hypothetical protein